MNKQMRNLLNELNIPENAVFEVSADSVIASVNRKLNLSPAERVRYRTQRLVKCAAVICALILALSLTAFAVSQLDFFGWVFGDTSTINQYIYVPEESVSEGRYLCKVEQAVATPTEAMAVVSIKGLTEESVEVLMDRYNDTINFDIDYFNPEEWHPIESSTIEMTNLCTENTRYWLIRSEGLDNPELIPLKVEFFFLDIASDDRMIIIPVLGDLKTIDILIEDENGSAKLNISPLSLRLHRDYIPEVANSDRIDTYFRMRDGSIRTVNEFFSEDDRDSGISIIEYEELYSHDVTMRAKEVIETDNIKAIIYNGVEYDVDNPKNHRPVEIPEELVPYKVKLSNQDTHFPAEEYCRHLKATCKRSNKRQCFTVRYRGTKYELTAGVNVVKVDGVENGIILMNEPYVDEQGRFMIPLEFLSEMSVYREPIYTNFEDQIYSECWIIP